MLKRLIVIALLLCAAACALKGPLRSRQMLMEFEMLSNAGVLEPYGDTVGGDSHAAYIPKLVAFAETLGWTVRLSAVEESRHWGLTYYPPKRIWVNTWGQSVNGQVQTLAHELAHVLQPNAVRNTDLMDDAFAESVALLYCLEIGLDTYHVSFSYLNSNPQIVHNTVMKWSKEIDAVVDQLVAGTR